jgi:hypothetical protein
MPAPFSQYIEKYYTPAIAQTINLESDNYWVVNIIFGHQGPIRTDFDPNNEGYVSGITSGEIFESANCSISNGNDISAIAMETIRDLGTVVHSTDTWAGLTIAHEIGHQCGLTHGWYNMKENCADCIKTSTGDPTCNSVGIMTSPFAETNLQYKFIDVHLNLLRSRKKSPKM